MNKGEITALINLLDDPDSEIFNHIQNKLISLGHDAIPALEDAWEHSFNPTLQQRIENVIHHIQFDNVKNKLRNWVSKDSKNLLEGLLVMAHYQYPDLNEDKVRLQIERIKQDVWLEIRKDMTALEKVKVINHILYDVHGFSGNTTNFHAAQNSFINNVLESKKGNPLLLSCVYSIIAQSLNIPIFGVNLPEHFVLAYVDLYAVFSSSSEDFGSNVLFYVNAFSKGTVFGKKEIENFLRQLKLETEPSYFEPCTNIDILKRVIRNLSVAFEKTGDSERIEELKELLKIIQ